MENLLKNHKGHTLPIVIMISVISSITVISLMKQISRTTKQSGESRIKVALINIAEGGKEHALSMLRAGLVEPIPDQTIEIIRANGFGGGSYYVMCSANNDGSEYILTSTATIGGETKSIQVVCAVESGIAFNINDGTIEPTENYKASIKCLGTGFQFSYNGNYYNAPIAIRVSIGGTTIDPWGSFTSRTGGNINDANNPREYIFSNDFAAGSKISVSAKVWQRTGYSSWSVYSTKNSSPENAYVKVLRNGDSVPQVSGFLNQGSIASYVSPYVVNGRISLESNQSILLFELYSLTGTAADFQDVVMLVTLAKPGTDMTQVPQGSETEGQKTYRVTSWREI